MLDLVMSESNPSIIRPSRLSLPGPPVPMCTDPPPPSNPASPLVIGAEGGATLHTPLDKDGNRLFFSPPSPSPGIQAKMDVFTHPQTWNREKHTDRLVSDLDKPNVTIQVKDNGGSVSVLSNPGFWTQVVKPTFCHLTKGFHLDGRNISFLLTSVRLQCEGSGIESERILRFEFCSQGTNSAITITLHTGTRNVHVQGQMVMPNLERSALWFVKTFLDPLFTNLAKKKQVDITHYHSALLRMSCSDTPTHTAARKSSLGKSPGRTCQGCSKSLRNDKSAPCAAGRCQLILHKKCAPISGPPGLSHTCLPPLPAPLSPTSTPPTLSAQPTIPSSFNFAQQFQPTTATVNSLSPPHMSTLPPSSLFHPLCVGHPCFCCTCVWACCHTCPGTRYRQTGLSFCRPSASTKEETSSESRHRL